MVFIKLAPYQWDSYKMQSLAIDCDMSGKSCNKTFINVILQIYQSCQSAFLLLQAKEKSIQTRILKGPSRRGLIRGDSKFFGPAMYNLHNSVTRAYILTGKSIIGRNSI